MGNTHSASRNCHWLPLVLVGLWAPMLVPAQQQEPPAFGVTSRLVEVSVVALDKKGAPVTDLRKEQFTVLDDGKRREVAFFRYEGGAAPEPARRMTPPPGVFSNRVEFTGGPVRNVTAIVLDSSNTEPGDLMMVKAQAMQSPAPGAADAGGGVSPGAGSAGAARLLR